MTNPDLVTVSHDTVPVHIGCSDIVVDCASASVVDPHRFRCGSDVDPDPDPGQILIHKS